MQVFNKNQTIIQIFFCYIFIYTRLLRSSFAINNVFDLNIEWQKWFAKPKLLLVNIRKNTLRWNSGIWETSSVYYYKQFVKKEGISNTAINHNIDYSSEFSLSLLLFWYMMMYWWLYDYSQVNVYVQGYKLF